MLVVQSGGPVPALAQVVAAEDDEVVLLGVVLQPGLAARGAGIGHIAPSFFGVAVAAGMFRAQLLLLLLLLPLLLLLLLLLVLLLLLLVLVLLVELVGRRQLCGGVNRCNSKAAAE